MFTRQLILGYTQSLQFNLKVLLNLVQVTDDQSGKLSKKFLFNTNHRHLDRTQFYQVKYRVTQKKMVMTKNRITSKILFRFTQNFSYIRSSLCSKHLQSFKFVLQNSLFHWRSKNVLQMSSSALQVHLDPAGKVLDDLPAFLPWDRSYCWL